MMAWETRAGSAGRYYTRSRKVGGRVRREYVGAAGSPMAQLAAIEDELHREAREQARTDRRTQRERLEALDVPLVALDGRAEALYRAALVLAGYHRHQRGEWRRRRARDA
jgi:hypothetical protein